MQTTTPDSDEYAFAISTISFLLASRLARLEKNDERKAKMLSVAQKKRDAVEKAFPEILSRFGSPEHSSFVEMFIAGVLEVNLRKFIGGWTEDHRTYLLIDVAFGDPFSPYELKFEPKDFDKAFIAVTTEIGFGESKAKSVLATKKDAHKAHHESHLWRIILTGGAVALVCAVGGWVAAPALAAAIGSAAGLSGAAATSYGLALLGGGSLAAGGLGMAGGLWIVTGAAAIGIGGMVTGGQILYSMGFAQARLELIKLQVTYKEVLLLNQIETAKAQTVITNLDKDRREIERILAEEKRLNESNSERVKDLEKKLKAIQVSLDWMITVAP